MRFSINKTELQNALAVVLKGVSTRSTLPVLSGILVSADKDNIVLQATDLELSVKYSAKALVEEPGSTVFPGKLMGDIVKSLPDAAVSVSAADDGSDAQIVCDTSAFSIRTLSASDFPGFPEVSPAETLKLPFDTFSQMVKRVAKVVSKDESRAILTGVLLEREGSILRMVATDSYRLAMTEAEIPGQGDADNDEETTDNGPASDAASFNVVIGGTFLNDVAGLQAHGETVVIGVSDNQIIITCADTTLISRRIEGQYPNYRQLLPTSHAARAKFSVPELSSGVKRASLMSSSSAPVKISLAPGPVNLATVTVNSVDLGSVRENIDCPVEGEEIEIAFNASYLMDGLGSMRQDEVYFDVEASLKPGVFHTIGSNEFLYLIMPVRI